MAALPLAGFGWGHWDRALPLQAAPIAAVMAAWALLHVGTMWLNAALDQDEEDVLYGRAVPVPPTATPAGLGALLAAVATASLAGPVPTACAAACALLAVLYSLPGRPWKAHPLGGPLVNVLGYGVLSPIAGWWLVDVPANPRTLASLALMVPWMLGCAWLAQAFQEREDRARGYRTLVATHGPRFTRDVARACLGVAVLGIGGLAVLGWYPSAALAAVVAFAWADRALRGEPSAEWARRSFGRLVVVGWILLAAVGAEYVREAAAGEPVAGLGTASGLPADRPRLPPGDLRRWEATAGRFLVAR